MQTYAYRAAFYCAACASDLKVDLHNEGKEPPPKSAARADSECWPQAESGSGEADTPNHCDKCKVWLENPLTSVGRKRLATTLIDAFDKCEITDELVRQWEGEFGTDHCPCDLRKHPDSLRIAAAHAMLNWHHGVEDLTDAATLMEVIDGGVGFLALLKNPHIHQHRLTLAPEAKALAARHGWTALGSGTIQTDFDDFGLKDGDEVVLAVRYSPTGVAEWRLFSTEPSDPAWQNYDRVDDTAPLPFPVNAD